MSDCLTYRSEISIELVKIDFNHQLAGVPLFFEGEILAVRELTEADMGGGCHHCHHEDGGCGNCDGGCDGCKSQIENNKKSKDHK